MNILQITSTDGLGGAAAIPMTIHESLKKIGYGSTVFTGVKYSHDNNVIKIKKTKFDSIKSHLLANDIDFFKTDYLIETDEFKRADIVHAHNLHGWYFNLNTLRKMSETKPVIWTLHDMWSITPHCAYAYESSCREGFFPCTSRSVYPSILWPNEKYLMAQKKEIYKNSNLHLTVPSAWLASKIKQSVLIDKPLSLIYNGINTHLFSPQDKENSRTNLKLPLNKKIILFIASNGLDNEFKGGNYVRRIAEKYKNNPEFIFVCVGGKTNEEIGNVYLRPGTTDKDSIVKYYSASDILLFPSLAENFSLVILEALACGLPVVAFDVGGVKEAVIQNKHGYVAEYKNESDLANGLENILSLSNNAYNELSEECKKHVVTNFSLEKMISEYINLYKQVI